MWSTVCVNLTWCMGRLNRRRACKSRSDRKWWRWWKTRRPETLAGSTDLAWTKTSQGGLFTRNFQRTGSPPQQEQEEQEEKEQEEESTCDAADPGAWISFCASLLFESVNDSHMVVMSAIEWALPLSNKLIYSTMTSSPKWLLVGWRCVNKTTRYIHPSPPPPPLPSRLHFNP